MEVKGYEPISTCTRRPMCNQIISYIIVLMFLVIYFISLFPNFNDSASRYGLTIVFLATLMILILSTLQTSWVDPADPIMIKYLNGERT